MVYSFVYNSPYFADRKHERKADVEFQETSCHNPIHSRIIKSTPSYSSCVFNTLTRELRVETNKNLLDQRGLVVLDKKTFLALSLTLTIQRSYELDLYIRPYIKLGFGSTTHLVYPNSTYDQISTELNMKDLSVYQTRGSVAAFARIKTTYLQQRNHF